MVLVRQAVLVLRSSYQPGEARGEESYGVPRCERAAVQLNLNPGVQPERGEVLFLTRGTIRECSWGALVYDYRAGRLHLRYVQVLAVCHRARHAEVRLLMQGRPRVVVVQQSVSRLYRILQCGGDARRGAVVVLVLDGLHD